MFSDKENVLVLIPEWRCEENEHIENLKTPKEHQERANPFYPQRKTAPSQVGTQFVEWQSHIADAAQRYYHRIGHVDARCHHQGCGSQAEDYVDGEESQQCMHYCRRHRLAVELHGKDGTGVHHPHKLVAYDFQYH